MEVAPIQLHDKFFVPYLDEKQVQAKVQSIANSINTDYEGRTPLVVIVLNGAFIFGADLLKRLTVNCEVAFIRVSSYRGTASTGEVKEMMPLGADVKGRDVIVVEDIVDSGLTMDNLRLRMATEGANSIALCTLLFKPDAFKGVFELRYVGFEIPDRFVVGYGLDYDGLGRNIPAIYQLKV
jgi:hypoxanthine phosphoribosyltransferase